MPVTAPHDDSTASNRIFRAGSYRKHDWLRPCVAALPSKWHTKVMKSTGMPVVCNVQVLADNVIPSIIGADGLEFTQVRTTASLAVPQHEQQQQTAVARASGRATQ